MILKKKDSGGSNRLNLRVEFQATKKSTTKTTAGILYVLLICDWATMIAQKSTSTYSQRNLLTDLSWENPYKKKKHHLTNQFQTSSFLNYPVIFRILGFFSTAPQFFFGKYDSSLATICESSPCVLNRVVFHPSSGHPGRLPGSAPPRSLKSPYSLVGSWPIPIVQVPQ